ncbi:MAG: sulfatase-like hydrolase/transferase [Bacteroidota bacterium]
MRELKKGVLVAALLNAAIFKLLAQQPNILWIVTDDQRADALAVYNEAVSGQKASPLGYVESPNIDVFAKEGVLFTNAYCNSPGCAPSRASMITGKYPHRSGIYGFEYPHTGPDFVDLTTPEVLTSRGYKTSRFGKLGVRIFKWQGEGGGRGATGYYKTEVDMKGLQQAGKTDFFGNSPWQNGGVIGTEEQWHYPDGSVRSFWRERVDGNITETDSLTRISIEEDQDVLRSYTRSNTTLILGGVSPQPAGKTLDGYITESFKNYLNNPNQAYTGLDGNEKMGPSTSQPQFIHLGYHFPHTPVLPPESFRERFKDKAYAIPDFSSAEVDKLPAQLKSLYNGMKVDAFSYEEKQQMIRDYYAFCAYGDELIGQSIAAFKEYCQQNGQEYLILLATGDHGWHLGEQGYSAKFGPYKQSNHTAVIVASSNKSKFPPNTVVDQFIEFVDFAPTFLATAGLNVNTEQYDYLDGYDLAEIVSGAKEEREYVLGEMNQVISDRAYIRGKEFAFSMRARKGWGKPSEGNILADVKWPLTTSRQNAELALFDLRVDPNEQNNVANDPEYIGLADWFRTKLGNIVLGDGRIECDWAKENLWDISNFAEGADDKKLDIPSDLIPSLENAHIPLIAISLDTTKINLLERTQIYVVPQFEPFNATNKNLIWETSDANVLSINNGVLQGDAVGTVTVTVKSEEDTTIRASFKVEVLFNPEPEPEILSVDDISDKMVAIYPNPTSGIINLDFNTKSINYVITDANGKLIQREEKLQSKQLDLSALKAGFYLIKFYQEDRQEVLSVLKK